MCNLSSHSLYHEVYEGADLKGNMKLFSRVIAPIYNPIGNPEIIDLSFQMLENVRYLKKMYQLLNISVS